MKNSINKSNMAIGLIILSVMLLIWFRPVIIFSNCSCSYEIVLSVFKSAVDCAQECFDEGYDVYLSTPTFSLIFMRLAVIILEVLPGFVSIIYLLLQKRSQDKKLSVDKANAA